MSGIFFSDGAVLLRTLIVGLLSYIALIILLRLSGRRTLSKMNAFDLVITVALGSTFATVLLNRDVSLAEGSLAFALLIALQYGVTWSSVRAGWVRKLVTGEPALLLYQGHFLDAAMKTSRMTHDEIRAAIRAAGHGAIEQIEAVVLETDGSVSVISSTSAQTCSALADVNRPTP